MIVVPINFRKLVNRLHGRQEEAQLPADFDPAYYRRKYPDVRAIGDDQALFTHYREWGQQEGRYPCAQAELEALLGSGIPGDDPFDLAAYRALNPDLGRVLQSDAEYVAHYIEHGRAEGRPCAFEPQDRPRPLWESRFSAAEYLAATDDPAAARCNDRASALEHFRSFGIDRLAPLNFADWFEPAFYRANYQLGPAPGDVDLYRAWLEDGLPAGRLPNERRRLEPMLAGKPFPAAFDWQGYCAAARLDLDRGRAAALAWLFEDDHDLPRVVRFGRPAGAGFLRDLCAFRINRGDHDFAAELIREWAVPVAEWSGELWRQAAAIAGSAGDSAGALEAQAKAVSLGCKDFAALDQLVSLTLVNNAPEEAIGRLEAAVEDWRGDARFAERVIEVVDRFFESLSAKAHHELRGGSPEQADTIITGGLDRICSTFDRLMTDPARLGSTHDGPVVMLAHRELRQCNHYRVEQKAEWFKAAGIDLRVHDEGDVDGFIADLVGAHSAIFYRVQATPGVVRAILTARKMGLPTFYEIDDLLFDPSAYPPPPESFTPRLSPQVHRGLRFAVPLFRYALTMCDRAIASTETLLRTMVPLTVQKSGLVIRNGVDARSRIGRPSGYPGSTDRIRIFYGSATLAHGHDFLSLAAPALARILDQHPQAELVLVGHVPEAAEFARWPGRVQRFPLIGDVQEYWALLGQCDINLAVLRSGAAEDTKSEIKWLEAALQGIASVVSDTSALREQLQSDYDVVFAASPDQWFAALDLLITDADRRREIGEQAQRTALSRFTLEAALPEILTSFQPAQAPAAAMRKPRVLVCNVYYPPQSFGGATRVVAANVRDIARLCPDLELGILTSDARPAETRLETIDDDGVPVFRLTLPFRDGADPLEMAAGVRNKFNQALDLFDPDLVHFHSIQRLSPAIVEMVRKRGIPYIVTAHDAWWISPNQFLVDADGFNREIGADVLAAPAMPPEAIAATAARRAQLLPLLAAASRRLTVSSQFAEVYRNAGVADMAVLANGVPALPGPRSSESRAGPLRLAHVGGRVVHKGSHIVEASLRLGHYPDLELYMIDGAQERGTRCEELWGATKVQLIAPVSPEEMAELYQAVDVVLAGSIWPESYGLVSREALHFGNWVVAGHAGAMGDSVIEGINGNLIDAGNRAEWDRLFAAMQADPQRFRRRYERSAPAPRTLADQAAELAALYRKELRKK